MLLRISLAVVVFAVAVGTSTVRAAEVLLVNDTTQSVEYVCVSRSGSGRYCWTWNVAFSPLPRVVEVGGRPWRVLRVPFPECLVDVLARFEGRGDKTLDGWDACRALPLRLSGLLVEQDSALLSR